MSGFVPGAGAGRKQVPLQKGYSLMNWVAKSNKDGTKLAGPRPGRRGSEVSVEELANHCTEGDIWMALSGKVYNLTAYMPYHPGGTAELMRAAGADGTRLFNEIHPWVNINGFLRNCYVGPLARSAGGSGGSPLAHGQRTHLMVPGQKPVDKPSRKRSTQVPAGMLPPPGAASRDDGSAAAPLPMPRRSFYQTAEDVVIVLYCELSVAKAQTEQITVSADGATCHVTVTTVQGQYRLALALSSEVEPHVRVEGESGKLLLRLKKSEAGTNWPTLGVPLSERHDPIDAMASRYQPCTLVSVRPVTHDTSIYTLLPPVGQPQWQCKLGQHIQVKVEVDDSDTGGGISTAIRSYTLLGATESSAADVTLLSSSRIRAAVPSGGFEILVKRYPDGVVSPKIASLELGQNLHCTMPIGAIGPSLAGVSKLALVAAGTGVTPMVQFIDEARSAAVDTTLILFNKSERDMLLRDELAAAETETFRTVHVLSDPPNTWEGATGRVSTAILQAALPARSHNVLALVCGPIGFSRAAEKILSDLDYRVHIFS